MKTLRPTRIYLGLGSNLGDRMSCLQHAEKLIGLRVGRIRERSRFYESEPWGYASGHTFINACLAVDTCQDPFQVVRALFSIEQFLGRSGRSEMTLSVTTETESDAGPVMEPATWEDMTPSSPGRNYADRHIDLDLLLFGDLVLENQHLKLPHPRMEDRKFVLLPLAEIAPEVVHPVKNITIREMLKQCTDPGVVRPLP
ncbi:MAG TPA: 2-amino-4-hydroxy-6-hydroxymethyldihydropteridine diphosphokinase [Bacteroides sp.]|nr:2-amino-4-hydroxy-6-hydroxymethyldihydropteridine diphosphokinase [Bacteroides sp.]